MHHTPGTWTFDGYGISADGNRIATCPFARDVGKLPVLNRNPHFKADSLLIAASKELLSELVSILRCFDRDNTVANHFARPMGTGVKVSITYSQIKRVRAAIAKATKEGNNE